jgi:ketosteroid isomerase-like protein
MSQENVDLVQRLYETGLFDQDPAEWLPGLATQDIEYVNPPYAVEPGVRRGPENVVAAMRRFAEVWRGSRHELHRLFDGGDVVVAAVSWYTLTRGSETEILQEEVHTWTIREGRIARWEWGLDLSSALRAAGLDR